jgi:hypothetical protein
MFLSKKEKEQMQAELNRLYAIQSDYEFLEMSVSDKLISQIANLELLLVHDSALWDNEFFESQKYIEWEVY